MSDGTRAYFYIDGTLVGSRASITFTPSDLTIGDYSAGGEDFNGMIDDVRIYNRALSAAEVKQLYNLGAANAAHSASRPNAPLSKGLVGYWLLDGSATNWRANTTADLSGNGNTGTLVSMSTSTSGTPGKIGQALKFDGTGSFIMSADADPLDAGTGSFSYGGYFRTFVTASNQLVSKRAGVSTPFTGYEMFINFGQIACTLDDGTSDYLEIDSPTTLNDGLWHSAFCVIDRGGNELKMYIDGAAVAAIVANGTNDLSQFGSLTNSTDFHIGRFSGVGVQYFDGSIDDVTSTTARSPQAKCSSSTIPAQPMRLIPMSAYQMAWWATGPSTAPPPIGAPIRQPMSPAMATPASLSLCPPLPLPPPERSVRR